MQIRMIADFKQYKQGDLITDASLDEMAWLVSRQYAVTEVVEAAVPPANEKIETPAAAAKPARGKK